MCALPFGVMVSVNTAYESEESSVAIAAASGCLLRHFSTASGMCWEGVVGTPVEQGLAR